MEFLLHNPIADMYGPVFLIMYGCVIAITYTFCRNLVQDPTINLDVPLIPQYLNPYELAYFRGGENAVIHVAIAKLIKIGYLEINENRIQQILEHPAVANLSILESVIFKWFASPKKADFTFDLSLQNAVQAHCNSYQQVLKSEQLLYPKSALKTKINSSLIALAFVLSLGGYKLLIASLKGHHNVAFLYIMSFIAIILFAAWLFKMPPRLSNRGERYLTRLQDTFSQLKTTIKSDSATREDYLLSVALFGVDVLYDIANDPYFQLLFPPQRVSSTTRFNSYRMTKNSRIYITGSSYGGGGCSSSAGDSGGSSCGSGGGSCGGGDSGGSSCGSSCGGGCGGCGG